MEQNSPAVVAPVEPTVRPSVEAEALRNLADHAKFEAAAMGACDGSMSAQRLRAWNGWRAAPSISTCCAAGRG